MRTRATLAFLVVPFIAACGAAKTTSTAGQSGSSAVSGAPSSASHVTINKSFWFTGFKVTLDDASVVTPLKPSPGYPIPKTKLLINATFENLGPDNAALSYSDLVVQSGVNSYLSHDSQDEKIPEVPGLQRTMGTIAFYIDDKFSLNKAILLVGNPRYNQAQVPLGSTGKYTSLEPQKVAMSGTINLPGAFTLAVSGGDLAYDDLKSHQQKKAGEVHLTAHFAATGDRDGVCCLSTDNLILKLPDGTALAATRNSTYSLPGKGLTTADETAEWVFKAADGAFDMIVKGKYGAKNTDEQADLAFNITVGVSASSSGPPPAGGSFPSPSDGGVQPTPSGH